MLSLLKERLFIKEKLHKALDGCKYKPSCFNTTITLFLRPLTSKCFHLSLTPSYHPCLLITPFTLTDLYLEQPLLQCISSLSGVFKVTNTYRYKLAGFRALAYCYRGIELILILFQEDFPKCNILCKIESSWTLICYEPISKIVRTTIANLIIRGPIIFY